MNNSKKTATTTPTVFQTTLGKTTVALLQLPLPVSAFSKIRHILSEVHGGNDNLTVIEDPPGFLRIATIAPEPPPRPPKPEGDRRQLYRYKCGTGNCGAIWEAESHNLFCRSCGQSAEERTPIED